MLSLDRVFCFPACQLIHLNWQVLSVNLAGEYNVIVSLLSLYENYILMLRYSFITESKAKAKQSRLNQTHIRLERALFIRTKYTMPMFGVIHFLMLQNNTYTAVFCLFLFFVFCQAHHCGALIQKHSSIVTVFLSLTHSHIFVWFFSHMYIPHYASPPWLQCAQISFFKLFTIIIKRFGTWADFQISWTIEGRR